MLSNVVGQSAIGDHALCGSTKINNERGWSFELLRLTDLTMCMHRVPEECTEEARKLYLWCVDQTPGDRPTSVEVVNELRRIQPHEFTNPEQIL
jgi:hypothetical protein